MTLPNSPGAKIEAIIRAAEPELVAIRRDLHAHPEIGFEVERTAGVVADRLRAIGLQPREGVGRTGVTARIDTGRPGPHLLLRADMDALPIVEATGLPFASEEEGKMHACGHDLHTATLLGAAEALHRLRDEFAGTITLMFQPAEETPDSGAAAMIADGVLDGVDFAIGFHNYPEDEVGCFTFVPGLANGSADDFEIEIRGQSGHAARPQAACDPIVAAATLVLQLQTIVSREVDPMHPAVLTVGAIEGGQTHNIIPDACRLRGTVRTQHRENRDLIEAAIARLCDGIERSMRVTCRFEMARGVPSLTNDPKLIEAAAEAIGDYYGRPIEPRPASLGAEDFALIGERVPAFQLGIGSATPGRDDRLHNSDYQPDERSIAIGAVGLSLTALRLLVPRLEDVA